MVVGNSIRKKNLVVLWLPERNNRFYRLQYLEDSCQHQEVRKFQTHTSARLASLVRIYSWPKPKAILVGYENVKMREVSEKARN
jgi:hypothetical protein